MKLFKTIWHLRRVFIIPPGAPRLNALAALISLMALGILFLTFRATPAGAGLDPTAGPALQLAQTPVPATTAGKKAAAGLSREELNRQIHHAVHGSLLALKLHVALLDLGKHRI